MREEQLNWSFLLRPGGHLLSELIVMCGPNYCQIMARLPISWGERESVGLAWARAIHASIGEHGRARAIFVERVFSKMEPTELPSLMADSREYDWLGKVEVPA